MTPSELQLTVRNHLEVIKRRGGQDEDGRIELKRIWPSPQKVAERLAAHANASRGQPAIWIIGA